MNKQNSARKVIRICLGDAIQVNHKPKNKITDSRIYYLKDLAAWQTRKTIAQTKFVLIEKPTRIKPVTALNDDDIFLVRHGNAFSYYRIRIRSSYERREKIESVYISKVIA